MRAVGLATTFVTILRPDLRTPERLGHDISSSRSFVVDPFLVVIVYIGLDGLMMAGVRV